MINAFSTHSRVRLLPDFLAIMVALVLVLAFGASSALAAGAAPGWELTARTYPTYIAPSSTGTIGIDVFNVGAEASTGTITVTDTLPAGLTAIDAGELGEAGNGVSPKILHTLWECTGDGPGNEVDGASVVTCSSEPGFVFDGGGGAPTSAPGPNLQPRVGIAVRAAGAASGLLNHVTIAGGGAPTPAATENPVTISSQTPPFSFTGWDGWLSNADGTIDTQAGSHPYEAQFTFDVASALDPKSNELVPAGGELRDIEVQLPPGLVGDPTAVPQCTRAQFVAEVCPQASEIGVDTAYFSSLGGAQKGTKVFNLVPPAGEPAQFGFVFEGLLVFLDSTVRTGSDYGVTTRVKDTPQRIITENLLTLWDVPGEASHNLWRNGIVGGCTQEAIHGENKFGEREGSYCQEPFHPVTKPLLTVPTSCSQPGEPAPVFTIHANTWQDPNVTAQAQFAMHDANDVPVGVSGCETLGFGPLFSTAPDTTRSDSPAGLTVEVKPPIGGLQDPELLGTSDIQDTTVALPAGFVINPGQAAGLAACQPAQSMIGTEAAAQCPGASKVGTVTIKSPLIEGAAEKQFEGSVYVLQSDPPELKLLIAASADGVNLKLVGIASLCETAGQMLDGRACEAPGQIITRFSGTPELPFTVFKLSFTGGAQAALDTPTQCGTFESTGDFTRGRARSCLIS